jgi:hypothetical protein
VTVLDHAQSLAAISTAAAAWLMVRAGAANGMVTCENHLVAPPGNKAAGQATAIYSPIYRTERTRWNENHPNRLITAHTLEPDPPCSYRTQEVAGSGPASSTLKPCTCGLLYSKAAPATPRVAIRLVAGLALRRYRSYGGSSSRSSGPSSLRGRDPAA